MGYFWRAGLVPFRVLIPLLEMREVSDKDIN